MNSRLRSVPSALCAAIVLGTTLGCGTPERDVAFTTEPIVGGTEVPLCGWPTAVLANGCSGSLIHPRVVLTAAHCVNDGIARIEFGESIQSRSKIVNVSRCVAHPSYSGETNDIGFCLLASEVTGIPAVPVMASCEASLLRPGVPVVEVGFGQYLPQTSANDGFGVKRFIDATIREVTSRGQVRVTTGDQNGEYLGDSGGPLFFQMPDQTWRVIGADCCGPTIVPGSTAARVSIYTSVAAHLEWLESTSGVDLTPCHDRAGWSPSASCADFATSPAASSCAWAWMCRGRTASPEPTCGGSNGGTAGGSNAGQAGTGPCGNGSGGAEAAGRAGTDTGGRAGAGTAGTPFAGAAGNTGIGATGGGGLGGTSPSGGEVSTAGGGAAGVSAAGVAGDAMVDDGASRTEERGGCACAATTRASSGGWMLALALFWFRLRRHRSRSLADERSAVKPPPEDRAMDRLV